jgi:hypothetical protein
MVGVMQYTSDEDLMFSAILDHRPQVRSTIKYPSGVSAY